MNTVRASLLATLVMLAAHPAAAQKQFTLTGDAVAIYNLAGKVTIEAGSGSAVTVSARPQGDDAAKLTFEQGSVRGRNALRVIYPSDRIVYSPMGHGSNTQFSIREDGTFGDDDNGHHHDNGSRRIRITGSGSGLEAWVDLTISVPAGKKVVMALGVGDITATNVNGDLRLDTSTGQVSVSGITGDLSVDTGSGDVRLTNISGGELSIDTGSGEVNATDVKASSLHVDTGSGDVTVRSVTSKDVDIDTGSGSVDVAFTSAVDNLKVDTGSGSVTIGIAGTLDAQVGIETGSGDISTDFPIKVRKTGDDELVGTIGNGSGSIEIDTGSGDVRLLKR